ncbi:hypothetical protein [Pedobacter paludis]|uniref:Uncharacterized protein n=1 Tax=Pedobacter paludis TaxID=2203212 RepID=A0A317F211_9SPHI|nr:hypothetical protein [Pedobacter paludis]PWS31869.1 hypothetical protein DF947_08710 [Pedobacter paludis]
MKAILNKPELVLQFQKTLTEIEELCTVYDLGDETVVQLIAEKIILIFHNTDQAKSLLNQLKLTHVLMYCSAETYNSKSPINFIGLLKLEHRPGTGWVYVARLDGASLLKVSQENWWQNKKVIVDSDGVSFTRAKIIKSIADSGPINFNTSGWKLKNGTDNKSIINPAPEAVRQIAFEMLQSLKNVDFDKESKLYYKS